MANTEQIELLKRKLAKIEKELDKNRGTVLVDGWQTQRYAKKARKWDVLAQEKMRIIGQIDDLSIYNQIN